MQEIHLPRISFRPSFACKSAFLMMGNVIPPTYPRINCQFWDALMEKINLCGKKLKRDIYRLHKWTAAGEKNDKQKKRKQTERATSQSLKKTKEKMAWSGGNKEAERNASERVRVDILKNIERLMFRVYTFISIWNAVIPSSFPVT